MISILGSVAPTYQYVLFSPVQGERRKRHYREFFIQLNLFSLTGCPLLYDTILCTILLLEFPL